MTAERSHKVSVRPFWSVMIPVYNRTEYLSEALASVLAQDPGPDAMQIAVVDDSSTTVDVAKVIREGGFSQRVQVFRTAQHTSIGSAWNACITMALGEWIHILHSDDVVAHGYYKSLRRGIESNAECAMAYCRAGSINEAGHGIQEGRLEQRKAGILSDRSLERLIVVNHISCPSVVVKREIYREVGGFREDLSYCLDWEMWQRIALYGPVWYEPQILLFQRHHSSSETSRARLTDPWLRDNRKSLDIVRGYLPSNKIRRSDQAFVRCGLEALWLGFKMAIAGRILDAFRSMLAAFEVCVPSECRRQSRILVQLRLLGTAPWFFAGKLSSALLTWFRFGAPTSPRTASSALHFRQKWEPNRTA